MINNHEKHKHNHREERYSTLIPHVSDDFTAVLNVKNNRKSELVELVSLPSHDICSGWQGPANGNMAHLCSLRPLALDYDRTAKHLLLQSCEL